MRYSTPVCPGQLSHPGRAAGERDPAERQNLTYDPNGNLTGHWVNAYTWNARNQLASINAGTYSFQYDALGRRVANSGTAFLYDGANRVQDLSGGVVVANQLTGGIDEFFSRSDSTGTYSPLADALGSIIALTDSTGSVQTQYTYEPFGDTIVSGPANGNPFHIPAVRMTPLGSTTTALDTTTHN